MGDGRRHHNHAMSQDNTHHRVALRGQLRRRGFTLVELLVVIGIILVLASFIMPAAQSYFKRADRIRTRMDLQAISTALDAYRDDFNGLYPMVSPTSPPDPGLMTFALLGGTGPGPTNGMGNGFRQIANGRNYGPYVQSDRFQMATGAGAINGQARILDRYGNPIQYLPRRNPHGTLLLYPLPPAIPVPKTSYVYDARDADSGTGSSSTVDPAGILAMLGDDSATTPNNVIDANERLRYSGAYILISAGPDKKYFGPTTGSPNDMTTWNAVGKGPSAAADATDDVYNFERQ